MTNITQYVQRTTPQSNGPMARASAPNLPADNTFGIIADTINGMLQNQQKREDEKGRAWAIDAVSQARLHWSTQLAERQASAAEGADNFTQSFVSDFDEYSKTTLENAPGDPARKYLHERLADIRTQLGEKAITFEASARVDYRDNKFNSAIENTQKLMMTDPSQFEVGLGELIAVIGASELPPATKANMRDKAVKQVAMAAVTSQMQKSPDGFMQSIGMGGGKNGAGFVKGETGNKAFDILSFEERTKVMGQALTMKNSLDSESERTADRARKDKGDEMMKEALSRLDPQPGGARLDREFIEAARHWVSPAEYKSLLQMQRGGLTSDGSSSTRSDPGTYRYLQQLLRDNPELVQKEAFTAHANGHISNSDLSSITQKASTLDRQGGPKTVYERMRNYISGSLDPGPMVQDPRGRGRLASALNEFDAWVEGEGKGQKRSDAEIEARGEEIIRQWQFVDLRDTAAGLSQPRFGRVSKGGPDFKARKAEINAIHNHNGNLYQQRKITEKELLAETARLNKWFQLVLQEEAQAKKSQSRGDK